MKFTFSLLTWLLLFVGGSLPVLAQVPTITGFTPASAAAGALVTITGTNLNTVRGVRFHTGGLALFTAQSATSITVRVPVDAVHGPIKATSAAGVTVRSFNDFIFLVRPVGMLSVLSPAGPLDVCAPRALAATAATPAFATGSGFNGTVTSVVVQPDGKLVVGGSFNSYKFVAVNNLIRLNPDGSRDATFTLGTGCNSYVSSLALQADGKVLVGGGFTSYNGTAANRLIRLNTDGTADATFNTGSGFLHSLGGTDVASMAVQSDGKVLLSGRFDTYNGTAANALVRLNTNGTRDASFYIGNGFLQGASTVALQADGKVLVGGLFSFYDGAGPFMMNANRIIRLKADGKPDSTFKTGAGVYHYNPQAISNAGRVHTIAVQADGNILIGGHIDKYNDTTVYGIVRIKPNGSRDRTFNAGVATQGISEDVQTIVVQPDGRILAGKSVDQVWGFYPLIRYNADGTVHHNFTFARSNANGNSTDAYAMAVQPDGKLVVGGDFDTYNGTTGQRGLVRLNPDYALDTAPTPVSGATFTFSPGNTTVNPLVTTTVGSYSAVGNYYGETLAASNVVTLTACSLPTVTGFSPTSGPPGTLVTISGSNLSAIQSVRFGSGGRGLFTAQSGTSLTVRVPADAASGVLTLTPGAGNAVVSAGAFTSTPPPVGLVATLSGPAGPLDACQPRTLTAAATTAAINTGAGLNSFNNRVTSVVIQGDGKVVVGGQFSTYLGATHKGIIRLNPDGTPDATFVTGAGFNVVAGANGNTVQSVALQADGKVLVGGKFGTYQGAAATYLARLNADGSRDASFVTGAGFNAQVRNIVVQPDGKVLVSGDFSTYQGANVYTGLIRLNPDGSRDASFGTGTLGINDFQYALATQADGKVLVGGAFTSYNGTAVNRLVRLNLGSALDFSFNIGTGFTGGSVYALREQADGKVLVGGNFTAFNGTPANGLVRLNPDGSRDASFGLATNLAGSGNGGGGGWVHSLVVQADGKVVAGGNFAPFFGAPSSRIARLNADGSVDASFVTGAGFDGFVYSVAVQADGKLLTGGSFLEYDGAAVRMLTRLNPNGSLNNVPAPFAGASFTFSPGNTTTNPLVTSTAGTYSVVASANGVTSAASNALTITACPPPTISGFTPTSGESGTVVTVTGTNLASATAVTVNGGAVAFTPVSATSLTFTTALSTTTGVVRVTTPGGTATGGTFTVPVPTISGFTPASGESGTVVTVTGTNLAFATAVTVNGGAVAFSPLSATSLTFTTAAGTTTGVVRVTTPGGTATGGTFTVTNIILTGFSPASGAAGTLVTITGTTLDRIRSVRFGTGGLGLFTAQSATSLTVRVPVDAATGALTLTTNTNTTASPGAFAYTPRPAGLLTTLSPAGPLDLCQNNVLTATAFRPAFGIGTGFNADVLDVAVQTDGRVVVGGSFTTTNGAAQNRLVRLLPDGSRDVSFGTGTGFDGSVTSVAVQADGKVLAGGAFTAYNGTPGLNRLVRLNADGTRDASFVTGTGFDGAVQRLLVQPDGKVLVSGDFAAYQGTVARRLIRLNADGSADATFGTGTGFNGTYPDLALQPDGKLIVGGNFTTYNSSVQGGLVRLNADGSVDATFGTGTGFTGAVSSVAVQADGKVLVGGDFTAYNGTPGLNRLVRLNANGSLDATFAPGTGFDASVRSLTIQPDGKVLAAGSFTAYNGTPGLNRLARLTTDGALDATFGTGAGFNNTLSTTALQADGSVLAGGLFTSYDGTPANSLARLTATGALDTAPTPVVGATYTFTPAGGSGNQRVVGQPGNYSAVASLNGETSPTSNVVAVATCPLPVITAFTPTSGSVGTVVTLTGENLGYIKSVKVNGAAVVFTIVSATSLTFTIGTGTTTGAVSVTNLGTTTGGIFTVTVPAISSFAPISGPAGTLVTITGTDLDRIRGVRFGTGDLGLFTAQSATSLTVRVPTNAATGALTLTSFYGSTMSSTGSFTYTPRPAGLVALLSPAGPLDVCAPRTLTATAVSPAFATGTGLDGIVSGMVVQTDGKLLVGGNFTTYDGVPASRLLRLLPNGSPDATFATGTGFDAVVNTVAVQADGKVLVGGSFTTYNGTAAARLLRLNADGTLDATFSTGTGFGATAPATPSVQTVVVQPDGQILVGGSFQTYNGALTNRIVRLNPDGSRDATFSTATGFDGTVYSLAVQADGQVLVGGSFTQYGQSTGLNRILRLNANGSRDFSFFIGTGFSSTVNSVVVQPDGKVVVGGNFTTYQGTPANRLIRLNPNGTRDATFVTGSSFNNAVFSVALQPDGKLVIVGLFTAYNGTTGQNHLIRLSSDGTRDASFGTGTGFNNNARRVVLQADGRVVVAGGLFTSYDGTAANRLIRLNADGSPNTTATPVSAATFTFAPGGTTGNPLITSTAGSYSAVASLNGEASEVSNAVTLTACASANQAPTALALSNHTVAENTGANGVVGSLTTTDPDAGDTFTYALVSGAGSTDNALVNLNGADVRITASPDFEMQASYAIRIRTTDAGGLSFEQAFTLTVTDVAEPLTVSTPATVPGGRYSTLTITGTGVATLTGAVEITEVLLVQNGGQLNTNCQPLTGAGSFTLAAGATLSICDTDGISQAGPTGAVQVTGARSFASAATYSYHGTQPQITGDGLPATVRALETANAAGVTLTRATAVTDALRLTSGTLATGGQLTLLSTAARTAYAAHTGGLTSGTVAVQRYVPTPTAVSYHHLSSPVQVAPVSDLATPGFTPIVNPAYNTLPYVAPLAATFPNVFGYDETRGGLAPAYQDFQTGYFSPATLATSLTPGRGYSVAIAGGKTPDFVGALTTGNVNVALSVTGTLTAANKAGWHLLGNPYPQPIDWDLLATPAGLDASVYVWYSTGGSNGAYRVRNASGVGNLTDGLIGVGQGFFVRASAPTTLPFTNALRVEANAGLGRAAPVSTAPRLTLTLAQAGASAAQTDEATIYEQPGATAGFDGAFDAARPGHNVGVPTLSALISGQEAMISAVPEGSLTDGATVELTLDLPAAGTYALRVGALTSLSAVTLLDRLTGTRYDLTTQPAVAFTATRAGVVPGRFALVFGERALGTSAETAALGFTLAPNPAHGVVRLHGAVAEKAVLLDAAGRTVRTWLLTNGRAELSLADLAPGVYSVRCGATTRRLVVE